MGPRYETAMKWFASVAHYRVGRNSRELPGVIHLVPPAPSWEFAGLGAEAFSQESEPPPVQALRSFRDRGHERNGAPSCASWSLGGPEGVRAGQKWRNKTPRCSGLQCAGTSQRSTPAIRAFAA